MYPFLSTSNWLCNQYVEICTAYFQETYLGEDSSDVFICMNSVMHANCFFLP